MASVVRREPKDYPCGECNCVDGRDPDGGTWSIPGVIDKSPICLRRLVNQRSLYFLDLHRHYLNGVLPVAGGLLDQPYIYLRAMTIIEEWAGGRRR